MKNDRAGFTIIELLLVAVLGLLVMAGAYSTLIRQGEAYTTFSAMSGTQQDTRTGVDLLGAELRELSANGADLILATPDSIRFRALRSFGLLCDQNKINKKLIVAQFGVQPFRAGDSLLVYVDGDSLKADDDSWQREYVNSTSNVTVCGTTLGVSLGTLLPNANLIELTIGITLKADSVYPGAPIRSFDLITYGGGTWDGMPMLMRREGASTAPLLGPIEDPGGIEFSYYDGAGNELTSFPLDAATRASVQRIQVKIRAERRTARSGTHQDSLITDVYLRGS